MLQRTFLLFTGVVFIPIFGFAWQIAETENFNFFMEGYLRTDTVTLKNAVDLDSANSDDTTTYIGVDYNLGFLLEKKDAGPKYYLKLERNGPGDYDAPLFVHNALVTSGGRIAAYRKSELLPQVEEFWFDAPLLADWRFKAGLYTYEVANGFCLNGAFENYGISAYRDAPDFSWRFFYFRPDVNYKNYLGPRIRQDEEQGYDYEHTVAHLFAADVKMNLGSETLWPYIGVLADYTGTGKRSNLFSAPTRKDLLGTLGISWEGAMNNFSWKVEGARNFGRAKSSDPGYEDVYHTGYLFYTDLKYRLGKFLPSCSFLLTSGNKVNLDMAENQDSTLTSQKNRAFGYYSPFNNNLGDSISGCHADIKPIVAMSAGYGLNYGVQRPATFSASDFDNLILPAFGCDYAFSEKLTLGLQAYYLRAFERGIGMHNGEAKYLSRDLGYEIDWTIDYQLNDNVLLSVLGGCFFPGRYYKEERVDTEGSLFSPFVRGDGDADSAYQVEVALELSF